jgi:protein-disulfide isomerase
MTKPTPGLPLAPLLALLVAVALAAIPMIAPAADATDKWREEILLQLSELRKTQGELKQQVAELRAEAGKARGGKQRKETALDLSSASLPSFGADDAQIAIVEFSDFQCPYCRKHEQDALPALREKYLGGAKVRYFFIDYPLGFHSHAVEAAVAGACAHRQGAFWKMHDLLFDNQGKLGPDLYAKLAGDLGLDLPRFQSCLADAKMKQEISAHTALGDAAGVQGTPAFLVGRLKRGVLTDTRAISGARPFADFAVVLDQYLSDSQGAQAQREGS